MSDGMMVIIDDDGKARAYDDTYDITIHCESKEEQDEVKRRLMGEPDWIPCSKRLPDDLAEVNVTWVNPFTKSKPFTASAVFYEGKWYWYSSVCADVLGEYGRNDVDKVDDMIEITAWKPFPKPYREVTNEQTRHPRRGPGTGHPLSS